MKSVGRTVKNSARKPIKETTIFEASDYYFNNFVKKRVEKKNVNQEGKFLRELHIYLSVDCGLKYVHDVELIHMLTFQTEDSKRKKKCKRGDGDTIDPSTINRKFDFYAGFFERCRKLKFVRESPMQDLERLARIQKIKKQWEPEQVRIVLNRASDWITDAYWFMGVTGCRPSTLSRISFGHIDYEIRQVNLTSRKGRGGNLKIYPAPMTKALEDFLREHTGKAASTGENDPVFVNASGNRITGHQLSNEMHRLIHICGFKGLNLKGLRDTFITMVANSAGIHRAKILAGHADIRTTQIYYREDQDDLIETANVIPFKRKEVAG